MPQLNASLALGVGLFVLALCGGLLVSRLLARPFITSVRGRVHQSVLLLVTLALFDLCCVATLGGAYVVLLIGYALAPGFATEAPEVLLWTFMLCYVLPHLVLLPPLIFTARARSRPREH